MDVSTPSTLDAAAGSEPPTRPGDCACGPRSLTEASASETKAGHSPCGFTWPGFHCPTPACSDPDTGLPSQAARLQARRLHVPSPVSQRAGQSPTPTLLVSKTPSLSGATLSSPRLKCCC